MNVSLHHGGRAAPPTLDHAVTLSRTGRPNQAHAVARHLYDVAQQRGDQLLQGETADVLTECCIMMAQYQQGIGFARNARLIWESRGDLVRQAGATARLAKLLAWIGEPDAVGEAGEALDMAERAGDTRQIIEALHANGLVLSILKQHGQALAFAERSVALGRISGITCAVALSDLGDILVNHALAARDAGAPDADGKPFADAVARAIAVTWEARAAARHDGDGWVELLATNNIAEYSLHVADTETADAALEAFDDTPGEPTHRCRLHHLSVKGRNLVIQGRLTEAVSVFMECLAVARETDDLEYAMRCHLDLSNTQAQLRDFASALTSYRAFHETSVRQASEAATRRARLYALHQETEMLRATVADAQSLATALAASNAQLALEAETLTRTSLEDPLTGLPNRRRWDAAMTGAQGATFAVALIDVDHFKRVNDTFSHSVGDKVLREAAAVFSSQVRRDDLVVRYGGEEFALLMRSVDREGAAAMCERLRVMVQDNDWKRVAPDLALTISVGIAMSHEADTTDAVVHLADMRLYAAKAAGRNQVCNVTPQ